MAFESPSILISPDAKALAANLLEYSLHYRRMMNLAEVEYSYELMEENQSQNAALTSLNEILLRYRKIVAFAGPIACLRGPASIALNADEPDAEAFMVAGRRIWQKPEQGLMCVKDSGGLAVVQYGEFSGPDGRQSIVPTVLVGLPTQDIYRRLGDPVAYGWDSQSLNLSSTN